MKKLSMAAMLAAALLGVGAQAQDQTRDQIRDQTQDQTRELLRDQNIYGYQLMTPAEREQYRARMRAAQTNEERERIRAENHERMEARAREKGVNLPDVPPPGRRVEEEGRQPEPEDGQQRRIQIDRHRHEHQNRVAGLEQRAAHDVQRVGGAHGGDDLFGRRMHAVTSQLL